jgi:hypothetical protein
VAGKDKKSRQAIESLKQLSSFFAPGRFSAEVIDLYKNVELARKTTYSPFPLWLKSILRHPPRSLAPRAITSRSFAAWGYRSIPP